LTKVSKAREKPGLHPESVLKPLKFCYPKITKSHASGVATSCLRRTTRSAVRDSTRRPERYAMPKGKSVAEVKAELQRVLAPELATRKFSYPRSHGSAWTLTLREIR
jgi:hypothetical protein